MFTTHNTTQGDLKTLEEAYDAFLTRFPLCYGYWKKYVDGVTRLGGGRARAAAVYERSVVAAKACVPAWEQFCAWHLACTQEDLATVATTQEARTAVVAAQRARYERAVEAVGLDFGAGGLWGAFAAFEGGLGGAEEGVRRAVGVLLRACAVPLAAADALWTQLRGLVAQHALAAVLPAADAAAYAAARASCPLEEQFRLEDDTRRALLARAQATHDAATALAAARAPYERVVGHRAYFHVAPLEDVYLRAWRAYLALETRHGARPRIVALYERCLVACAYYPEFWVSYARFLEEGAGKDESGATATNAGESSESKSTATETATATATTAAEAVYHRAFEVLGHGAEHGAELPVAYAQFCEAHGRIDEARSVLVRAQEGCNGSACAELVVARAEFEVRQGCRGAAVAVPRAATDTVRDTPGRLCVWTRLCRLLASGDCGEDDELTHTTEAMLEALPKCAEAWACAVDAAVGATVWCAQPEARRRALALARGLLARMLGARAEAGALDAGAQAAWWRRWRALEARSGTAETLAGVAGDADAVARADAEHRALAQLLWVDSPAGRRALGV